MHRDLRTHHGHMGINGQRRRAEKSRLSIPAVAREERPSAQRQRPGLTRFFSFVRVGPSASYRREEKRVVTESCAPALLEYSAVHAPSRILDCDRRD